MKRYLNLDDVLANLDGLAWSESLFADHQTWLRCPLRAQFLYLDGDDELEDIFDMETLQPRLAHEAKLTHFLDVEIFKAVRTHQESQKIDSTTDDYVAALNYYREYDTFMVTPGLKRQV